MLDRKALLLVVTIALAGTATAQVSDQHSGPPGHVVSSFGFGPAANMIPAIRNAPFSGVLNSQSEQTLDDGTRIRRESQEVVMRDSQGSIYRARTIKAAGSTQHETELITIVDPSRHVEYLCTPLKVCRSLQYRDPSALRHPRFDPRKNPDVTVEDLGTEEINGFEVEGKRVTRMIPEGAIGNDRPFSTIEETWHSRQLDLDIQVKRTDPRMGTRTVTMTELIAGEPDAKYFEIPEGYRVEPMMIPTQPKPLAPFGPGGAEPGPRD